MKSFPFTASPRSAAYRGFTLVELLVSITIIAVLATLTFLVTARVKDQAIAATDTGKFRQVGVALASIAQENNGIIPHDVPSKPGFGIPGTALTNDGPNRFNFHEAIDRYFPPVHNFNSRSIYNYFLREGPDTIYTSKAVKPWPEYNPSASSKLPGPLWFSFNVNLNNGTHWAGRLTAIPDSSKIVICAETNHLGGSMQPGLRATDKNNVETRYRVSRAGKTALYLFVDGHVERLQGERGEAYYAANPGETNIWKWW
jgi:prepilin-type N-terminal cleavage/methylation domain-containing protein/prepilin-type processing-associated H-X9-DG protein